jgi:hypothetical protein
MVTGVAGSSMNGQHHPHQSSSGNSRPLDDKQAAGGAEQTFIDRVTAIWHRCGLTERDKSSLLRDRWRVAVSE